MLHELGEIEPVDAVWEAGVVLDQVRESDLAAGDFFFEKERLAPGTRRVKASRETSRAAANDHDVVLFHDARSLLKQDADSPLVKTTERWLPCKDLAEQSREALQR
jgi:hypothetical protein